jgi:hypothetical protein
MGSGQRSYKGLNKVNCKFVENPDAERDEQTIARLILKANFNKLKKSQKDALSE